MYNSMAVINGEKVTFLVSFVYGFGLVYFFWLVFLHGSDVISIHQSVQHLCLVHAALLFARGWVMAV